MFLHCPNPVAYESFSSNSLTSGAVEQQILFTFVPVIFIHILFERKFFLHTLDIQYPIAQRGCHTIFHLFKKLKLFFASIEFQK